MELRTVTDVRLFLSLPIFSATSNLIPTTAASLVVVVTVTVVVVAIITAIANGVNVTNRRRWWYAEYELVEAN
jgi:hypothetical protein